jgi:APA family basic amino acid/polyamine antiporter
MLQGQRQLGLGAATALVVANMVGTGVFTISGLLMKDLGSPWLVLLAWLLGGVIALLGALCYGALARRIPESGGEYIFLARTLHPGAAFVTGWLSLVVGFSATLGSSGFAFAEYVFKSIGAGEPPTLTQLRVVATLLLAAAALLHLSSVSFGARVQATVVVAEVLLITLFVAFGLVRLGTTGFHATPVAGDYGKMGVALILVSFAYLGWNAAVYIAGEIKQPDRNLPRSLIYGTAVVTLLYLALNAVFVFAVPGAKLAGETAVGDVVARELGGPGLAAVFSGLVALALAMCVSALTMTGPRVAARMATDGLLPKVFCGQAGRPPRVALLVQLALGLLALWTSTFGSILTYVGFTLGISTIATIVGLCRIRLQEGRARVPVPGWPWVPALFLAFVTGSTAFAVWSRPVVGLVGLATLGLFTAAYFVQWRSEKRKPLGGPPHDPAVSS